MKKEKDYLRRVAQAGLALAYVPVVMKSAEVCMEAVRQDGWALCYVPKNTHFTTPCRSRNVWNACPAAAIFLNHSALPPKSGAASKAFSYSAANSSG